MIEKRGIVIGKFSPPHNGHINLINKAREQVDRLYVLVSHGPEEIGIQQRIAWLDKIFPDSDVVVLPILYPKEDNSQGWAKQTLDLFIRVIPGPRPEVVFLGSDYPDDNQYAALMGMQRVNIPRSPISSTQIRENPFEHWDAIPPCVRSHYAKRVVILGAESSGTTTLANVLAEHYRTVWVPEFGRVHAEGINYLHSYTEDPQRPKWNDEDFIHIATMQNKMEDALVEHANKLIICDTDAYTTQFWYRRYAVITDPKFVTKLKKLARPADLYILTDVEGVPFVDDGIRDGRHVRGMMQEWFIEGLHELKTPFVFATGDLSARYNQATKVIDADLLQKGAASV